MKRDTRRDARPFEQPHIDAQPFRAVVRQSTFAEYKVGDVVSCFVQSDGRILVVNAEGYQTVF